MCNCEINKLFELIKKSGVDPTSPEVLDRAEDYRDRGGLLPDEILELCYPDFYGLQKMLMVSSNIIVRYRGGDVLAPQPLTMRSCSGTRLVFENRASIIPRFPEYWCSWPVIDMADATHCTLIDIRIIDGDGVSGCGIFMGRSAPDRDSNYNELSHVYIGGNYGRRNLNGGACLVNIGAELFTLRRVDLRFSGARGGAFYCSSYNGHRIRSPYGRLAGGYIPGEGGAISNCGGSVGECSHFAVDGPGDQRYRYICKLGSRTYHVVIDDTLYVTSKSPGACRAVFVLGDRGDHHPEFKGVHNCRLPLTTMHNEAFGVPLLVEDCTNIDAPQHVLNPAYKQ